MGAALALGTLMGGSSPARAVEPAPVETPPAEPREGVVNINQATPEELTRLPGIGPAKAEQVVAYRAKHEFKKVVELARVKGIGPKTVSRLKPWLTLSGPTTLKEKLKLPSRPKEG